jgi:hypothetical protein
VLAIRGASVKPEGIFDPAFDYSFVEGDGDVFVGLGHGLSHYRNIAFALAATIRATTPILPEKRWDRPRECQAEMHWIDKSCC